MLNRRATVCEDHVSQVFDSLVTRVGFLTSWLRPFDVNISLIAVWVFFFQIIHISPRRNVSMLVFFYFCYHFTQMGVEVFGRYNEESGGMYIHPTRKFLPFGISISIQMDFMLFPDLLSVSMQYRPRYTLRHRHLHLLVVFCG